jgi:hypothetical protein
MEFLGVRWVFLWSFSYILRRVIITLDHGAARDEHLWRRGVEIAPRWRTPKEGSTVRLFGTNNLKQEECDVLYYVHRCVTARVRTQLPLLRNAFNSDGRHITRSKIYIYIHTYVTCYMLPVAEQRKQWKLLSSHSDKRNPRQAVA